MMPFSLSCAADWRGGMAAHQEATVYDDEVRSRYGRLEKMTDLVAVWEVALSDGIHKIEFEHGTTSGKRVVYVDGKEIIRKDWMFKLVGKETFPVGASQTKATINIDAVSGFAYEYTLEVNGKSLKKYMENRSKTTNTWLLHLDGEDCRVVLGGVCRRWDGDAFHHRQSRLLHQGGEQWQAAGGDHPHTDCRRL
ncbi:fas apoptotic inhibitory molecule 1 isoform X3 [Pyxicephalus adspersus]|uniref:fas apoptotic inhibitory molecule 1 isoform X3 n=1 Tax=Pyxicephalus adspersus TaxID=30357 RepID=UPI003B5CE386